METNILTAIMVIVNKIEVALLWTKNVLPRPKPDKLKAGLYSQLFVLASLFSVLSVAAATIVKEEREMKKVLMKFQKDHVIHLTRVTQNQMEKIEGEKIKTGTVIERIRFNRVFPCIITTNRWHNLLHFNSNTNLNIKCKASLLWDSNNVRCE